MSFLQWQRKNISFSSRKGNYCTALELPLVAKKEATASGLPLIVTSETITSEPSLVAKKEVKPEYNSMSMPESMFMSKSMPHMSEPLFKLVPYSKPVSVPFFKPVPALCFKVVLTHESMPTSEVKPLFTPRPEVEPMSMLTPEGKPMSS